MWRRIFFLLFTISMFPAEGLGKVTVSGTVRDAATGEALFPANVIIEELGTGTSTNEYGFYALSLEPGSYTLLFSYVGYATESRIIDLNRDMVLNMELQESLQELEEVTISSQRYNTNISELETGSTRLPIQSIRKIPALLGEIDVIKAIQLLPGVQVTSEGSSGFSVRGGGRDQNLILLDESTVYNASHLMGFFSVFNNDVIKDVKLYKGDIPASSGGRLASLLDVRMKEGNSKQFSGRGGMGTISARLSLEGPIVQDKVSFLLAGRRTYADLFLLFSRDENLRNTRLYFYDLNGKVNYRINDKNRVYLSVYSGKDTYANKDYAGMVFGNRTFTFRWNHIFSNNLFSNFTLVNSHYFYELGTPEESEEYFNWRSTLDDYGYKGDFTWFLSPRHTLRFGLSGTYHIIKPGDIVGNSIGGIEQSLTLNYNYSLESGLYLSGESNLGDNFAIRYGLRYSLFNNVGPATVYEYDDTYQLIDSANYERGDFYNFYHGLEPRISANYMLSEIHSIKASYSRTLQYLQLATNSTAGTPLEIWYNASPNIEPQISDQLAVGYFRDFLDDYANQLPFTVPGTGLSENVILWQFTGRGDGPHYIFNERTAHPRFKVGKKNADLNVSMQERDVFMKTIIGDTPQVDTEVDIDVTEPEEEAIEATYPGLTNQDMINLFLKASSTNEYWEWIVDAQLEYLAVPRENRAKIYAGPKIEDLPNLEEFEKDALLAAGGGLISPG